TERFNGDVEDSKLNNDQYEITLKLDTGIYQINVASDSGEVLDVKRIKKEKPKKELEKEEIKEIIEQKQIGEIEDIHEKEDKKKYKLQTKKILQSLPSQKMIPMKRKKNLNNQAKVKRNRKI